MFAEVAHPGFENVLVPMVHSTSFKPVAFRVEQQAKLICLIENFLEVQASKIDNI